MMNQVMTPFQQQFGEPCLCRATLSVWEKMCLCRVIWRILLGAVDWYPEWWPVLWLPLSLNDHHTVAHGDAREEKWRGNWRMEWVASTLTPSPNVVCPALLKLMCTPRLPAVDWTDAPTDLNGLVCFRERQNLVSVRVPSRSARAILHVIMFDHKRDLVIKPFWPVFVIELNDTDMRLSQSMCFVVGMISGSLVWRESCLFGWMCSLLQPHILKCFYGAKQNPWDVRPPTTRDDRAGIIASYIFGPHFFDGSVSDVTCVKCGIMPEPSNSGIM